MKLSFASLSLLLCIAPLSAQDLPKVDRTIRQEPAYQSKQPKYCLLVFGPEAKHRVWLVQDGDVLYVDRNGNGDLTEAGEKVMATKGEQTDPKQGLYAFDAGDIPEGKLLHKDLRLQIDKLGIRMEAEEMLRQHLAKHPDARSYIMMLEVEAPGWRSVGTGGRLVQTLKGYDAEGVLAWSDRPATAPVVHFRGPWHLVPFSLPPKLVGGQPAELSLSVGTPGSGPGTTLYLAYEKVVPEKAYPKVEITYPPLQPGEPPRKERYELKERC